MRRVHLMIGLISASIAALVACDDAIDNAAEAVVSIGLNAHPNLRCKVVKQDSLPDDSQVSFLSAMTSNEDVAKLPRATGDKVSCLVRETGPSAYHIEADIKADARVFAIKGDVAAGEGENVEVRWVSPDLSEAMSDSGCKVTVDQQRKGGGAIRLSYVCDNFKDKTQPDSGCVASGSVVLERCGE